MKSICIDTVRNDADALGIAAIVTDKVALQLFRNRDDSLQTRTGIHQTFANRGYGRVGQANDAIRPTVDTLPTPWRIVATFQLQALSLTLTEMARDDIAGETIIPI